MIKSAASSIYKLLYCVKRYRMKDLKIISGCYSKEIACKSKRGCDRRYYTRSIHTDSQVYTRACSFWPLTLRPANPFDDKRSREFPWMEYVRFLSITECTFNPLKRVNFDALRTESKPLRYTARRGKLSRIRYGIEGFVVEYRKWRYSKSIVSPWNGWVAKAEQRESTESSFQFIFFNIWQFLDQWRSCGIWFTLDIDFPTVSTCYYMRERFTINVVKIEISFSDNYLEIMWNLIFTKRFTNSNIWIHCPRIYFLFISYLLQLRILH